MSSELAVYKKFEAGLALLETSNAEKKFEDTPDGLAERRAWYKKLRKGTNALTKLRKATNDESQKKIAACNAEAKTIQARLDVMELPHKTILDAEDTKVQKEIDDLAEANRLQAEKDENEREAYIDNQAFDNAKIAKELKDQQDTIDKQKAEIAATKKIEEVTKLAVKSAEEKAIKDAKDLAETVDRDAKAALATAAKDKQDAIDKIEQERKDKEQEEADEKERIASVERKRQANKKHRKKIETDVSEALISITQDEFIANDIVDALIKGEIPNIQINY